MRSVSVLFSPLVSSLFSQNLYQSPSFSLCGYACLSTILCISTIVIHVSVMCIVYGVYIYRCLIRRGHSLSGWKGRFCSRALWMVEWYSGPPPTSPSTQSL